MYCVKEEDRSKFREAIRQLVTGTYTGQLDSKEHNERLHKHLLNNYDLNE